MFFLLVVYPIPGLLRPTPHLSVSLTPLGLAALTKLLIAKKVIGIGLFGAKAAAIGATAGGGNDLVELKSNLYLLGLFHNDHISDPPHATSVHQLNFYG